MKNKILKILIGALTLLPLSVGAFSWRFWDSDDDFDTRSSPTATETTIVNEVNVSASTGGNTATSGNVVTGEAKASVKVKTEVNGEVIEDFDEEFFGETNFEREFEYATGTASTTTKIKVKTESFPNSELGKSQVRPVNNEATTTLATSTTATSTKVLPRYFNERVSNWFAKLFKNVFSIFKK